MSRSYRKHFWYATEGDRRNKHWFNCKLRHKHVESGSDFKKLNNSRDIHGWYIHYEDEADFVRQNRGYGVTDQELHKIWRKHFQAK